MDRKSSDETYSDKETARRRDEALRRALSTPPMPHAKDGNSRRKNKKAKTTTGRAR
jgi:hypothetical protein